jgi:hypothetical protein
VPVVERIGEDGVVYEELTDHAGWEGRQRSRSIPHSLELLFGALSIVALWLSTITAVLSLAMRFAGHHEPWGRISLWSIVVLAVSLVVSLCVSLTKKCPLCHGPPLHSRSCRKHRLADRWPPLTHRATTVLRMLTTLCFRCMYCGTPYRLFKRPSSRNR